MISVFSSTWALMLGMFLLMIGNGMQGTLLGIRGAIEGITTTQMSVVMAAYFIGFLGAARMAPLMIRRVGHVRVFAALGSLIAALLVSYSLVPHWIAWTLMRLAIGFCFCGVYVTAESWVNNASTNATRGKALSLYMIMQSAGIIVGQMLINLGDPAGFLLFIIPSVLVSLSFTPILLTVTQAPVFEETRPMPLLELVRVSPLGCMGTFLLGGVFSALFGMAAVWGGLAGLTVAQISGFVAAVYAGGLLAQYPIGILSDGMDRRRVILTISIIGALTVGLAAVTDLPYPLLLVVAAVAGGCANPLYSLLISHTNDFVDAKDMPSASGALLFMNGLGAACGPLTTGWIMGQMGPAGFFLFMGVLFAALAAYTGWRMTRRAPPVPGAMTVVSPTTSPVAVEIIAEVAAEQAAEAAENERADRAAG